MIRSAAVRAASSSATTSGEPKHRGDVIEVRGADRRERVLAVVRLVRQPEPGLVEVHDVPELSPASVLTKNAIAPPTPLRCSDPDSCSSSPTLVTAVDLGEVGHDRLRPSASARSSSQEARVEVTDLARRAARRRVTRRRLLDDHPQVLLGVVAQHVEPPVHRSVIRDLGLGEPAPVDVPEQVVLWSYGAVTVLRRDPRPHELPRLIRCVPS